MQTHSHSDADIVLWENNYRALKDFLLIHNGAYPNSKDDFTLFYWVKLQRIYKKLNKLTTEQINLLDAIPLMWDNADFKWHSKANQFLNYITLNKKFPEAGTETELVAWYFHNRKKISLREQSGSRKIKWMQIEDRLKEFLLLVDEPLKPKKTPKPIRTPRRKSPRKPRTKKPKPPKKSRGEKQHYRMEQIIDKLVAFQNKFPHALPSGKSSEKSERSLYHSLRTLRKMLRDDKLSDDIKNRLTTLNIQPIPVLSNWMKRFHQLKQHFESYNQPPVPKSPLYFWRYFQLRRFDSLTIEQQQLLSSLPAVERKGNLFSETPEDWEESYLGMKKFISEHGRFPQEKDHSPLKRWASIQRKKFYENRLSSERSEKLKQLGFFKHSKEEREQLWQKQFQQLVEFRKKNPARWPTRWIQGEKQLALWCDMQKNRYNKIQPNRRKLAPHRIHQLNAIGFIWSNDTIDRKNRCDEIKKHIEKYSELKASKNQSNRSPLLYSWIRDQRIRYKKNKLSLGEIEQLISLKQSGGNLPYLLRDIP